MKTWSTNYERLIVILLFAIAMAWVESAVVYYLRIMIERIDPYQSNPLPPFAGVARVELIREFATLVMLATAGWLAGRNVASRLGYALIAFGVWDIFYYVFLKVMCGWPNSLLDWDILFLIPLPWWGPVVAPTLIAFLMITWGVLTTQFDAARQYALSNWRVWTLTAFGIGLALYVFMADAIRVAPEGEEALREMLPTAFNWPLFIVALLLMAVPVLRLGWDLRRCREWEKGTVAASSVSQ